MGKTGTETNNYNRVLYTNQYMYKANLWLTWRWFSSVFTEKDTCLILKDEYLVSRYEWIHMDVSETQNCFTDIYVDLTNYKWYRMYKWVIDSEQIQNAGVALIYRTSSPFWWSLTYPLSWSSTANIEIHSLCSASLTLTHSIYELNHERSYEFPCSCLV